MSNLAALVEYDGTRFAGYQVQPADKGSTVQGALEAAIARVAGLPEGTVRIEAAGRTDAGVHASGQVVNFRTEARRPVAVWQRALNALLPADIAVRAVCEVPDAFRARYSALSRMYEYGILVAPVRAPLRERFRWRVSEPLGLAAMREAAALTRGEHDFGAFGTSPRGRGYTTVRAMFAAEVAQRSGDAPDEVVCRFEANAFLTGMVRRLVGTLVLVGQGRLSVAEFGAILAAAETGHLGTPAPACGLCLALVRYPAGMLAWEGLTSPPNSLKGEREPESKQGNKRTKPLPTSGWGEDEEDR